MTPGVYKYQLVDVFTSQPFCGNPIAVFTEARGLDDTTMQRIAAELGLSQTAFVFPSKQASCDCAVRIFTPTAEITGSGAPSLGTVFALSREAVLAENGRVVMEGKAGPVSVTLASPMTTMEHPCPQFGEVFRDYDAAAAVLGLGRKDILVPAPVQAVTCGVPFTLIPLCHLEALSRIEFRPDIWRRTIARTAAPTVAVFAPSASADHTVRARVFAPALGVAEEAATGNACGALIVYLVRHGILDCGAEDHFVVAQGVEMRRPSEVHVFVTLQDNDRYSVRIGGECVWVGQGELHLFPEQ